MNQKSSFREVPQFVSQVLTANRLPAIADAPAEGSAAELLLHIDHVTTASAGLPIGGPSWLYGRPGRLYLQEHSLPKQQN